MLKKLFNFAKLYIFFHMFHEMGEDEWLVMSDEGGEMSDDTWGVWGVRWGVGGGWGMGVEGWGLRDGGVRDGGGGWGVMCDGWGVRSYRYSVNKIL